MERVVRDIESMRVIHGKKPKAHEKEFSEMLKYESGQADIDANQVPGPFSEPWLNVIHAYEPASMPAFEEVLKTDILSEKIHGKVLDVGAGTCWLTAKVSLLPCVEQVFALDLSEKFLSTTSARILKYFHADVNKVTFVISDFSEIPLEDESVDCALLFASIHHSLSPIKTLQEVGRCLKKKGALMVLESPCSVVGIRNGRRRALEQSNAVTEIAYTKAELEYLIEVANIGKVQCFPFDVLSRRGIKMVVRKILRYLGVEDVLLNPPTYLFLVEKK